MSAIFQTKNMRCALGLGDLEREVMEIMWTSPSEAFTVRQVGEYFPTTRTPQF